MKNIRDIEGLIFVALGEASALFMTQECKGTEIVMPTEALIAIGKKLADDLVEAEGAGQ